jgi:lysophospholipid hydrolase
MLSGDQIDSICSSKLLPGLEEAVARELAEEFNLVDLRDKEVLVHKGDSDRICYLVLSGRLLASGNNEWGESRALFDVNAGESVGEMALLSQDLAFATLSASGDTQVAALTHQAFTRFSAAHPQAAPLVIASLRQRLQRQRLAMALYLGGLYDKGSPAVRRDLESGLEMFALYGGEVLFRQGEPGDFLCVVVSGRLRVVVSDSDGIESDVAELGSGEIVGEMAVVGNQSRSATVIAVRDCELAKLTKAAYEHFASRHPLPAVEMVSRKLAERLRETTAGIRRTRGISTVAIIPAQAAAPATEVAEALARALTTFGSTLHLSSTRVDEHFGGEGIAQTWERSGGNFRVAEWLSRQEIEHSYVLYQADPHLSPWTERCIRQADHIIVVADSEADPAPGEIETELLHHGDTRPAAPQWLALVHRQGNPSGTKRWLEVRNVERHFHVRPGDAASFERLARLITNRAVGLTLGGGFARGLAHVGVFRAFEDLGVAIDAMGGASMGAMVGALWAMGWDRERIIAETSEACSEVFGDLTFPFIAFKTGRKFSGAVRKLFGEIQIEDLWMPYFCISANLNRSELKFHTQGSLAKAILAATRAPGVFPPIVYEGELHIDGGVINNVPVDLMKGFCNEGITVGVDVSPPHELNAIQDYGDRVSGWSTFWRRCSPFSSRYVYTPSILLVMIRTLEYTGISNKSLRIGFADIYIYPELLKFKRTDFHLVAGIAQAGYNSARASVLEWLATSDVAATRRPDLAGVLPAAGRAEDGDAGGVPVSHESASG